MTTAEDFKLTIFIVVLPYCRHHQNGL